MPFSLSRSISSSTWSIISRSLIVLVACNSLSARVDLPWSIWAMIQKFRIFFMSSILLKRLLCLKIGGEGTFFRRGYTFNSSAAPGKHLPFFHFYFGNTRTVIFVIHYLPVYLCWHYFFSLR